MAASASQPDHLAIECLDEIEVVRLQVSQDEGDRPEPRQACRHPTHCCGLSEGRQTEHKHAWVGYEFGSLEPGNGVSAHGGPGKEVPAERYTDEGGACTGRERPQAADLNAGASVFDRCLDRLRGAATRPSHPRPVGRMGRIPRARFAFVTASPLGAALACCVSSAPACWSSSQPVADLGGYGNVFRRDKPEREPHRERGVLRSINSPYPQASGR